MTRDNHSMQRGFSLLEVMMAMMILAVVATGALLAMVASSKDLREGQLRQYKMALADAAFQRIKLADKTKILAQLQSAGVNAQLFATLAADGTPPATAVWSIDPTAIDSVSTGLPYDLSIGAYFTVLADGELVPLTTATVPTGTPCAAAVVPTNTYCREILVATGMPGSRPAPYSSNGTTAQTLSGASAVTYWVRVYLKSDLISPIPNLGRVVVQREASVQ